MTKANCFFVFRSYGLHESALCSSDKRRMHYSDGNHRALVRAARRAELPRE